MAQLNNKLFTPEPIPTPKEQTTYKAIKTTKLKIRTFGTGRAKLTIIEPENVQNSIYNPRRIIGTNFIIWNQQTEDELKQFFTTHEHKERIELFPEIKSSSINNALHKPLGSGKGAIRHSQ